MPASRIPLFAALLILPLAGCADPNGVPPRCPHVAVLADAGSLARYQGAGRDMSDVQLQARITSLEGQCRRADDGAALQTDVALNLDVFLGPAASFHGTDLPSFVALTRGDRILDKQIFPLHVDFPPNTSTLHITTQPVQLSVPTPRGVTGPDYTVLVGFQLTPAELATNRAHPDGAAAAP